MRTIKLSIIGLLLVTAVLVCAHRLFPSFNTSGQSSTLTAPTEVTASDNSYVTKVGINWAAVRGATLYRVFINSANNPATAAAIGTTTDSTFFDTTAPAGQTFFYWVRAENGSVVSPFSTPDQGSRAVGNVVGPVQPLNPPPAPPANPVTAAKAYLGKTLFWDEQLSSTRTVACGTCHFAANGGSDARAIVGNPRSTNPGADGVFNTADDVFASPGVITNNADGTYSLSAVYGFHGSRAHILTPAFPTHCFGMDERRALSPIRLAARSFCKMAPPWKARYSGRRLALLKWLVLIARGSM